MTDELNLHIKKLQRRAILSLLALLSAIISIGFGVVFLFAPSLVAAAFFAAAMFSIAYFLYLNHSARHESEDTLCKPATFTAHHRFSFSEVVHIFESLTNSENQLSVSEDVRFYRFRNIFQFRVILYRTDAFTKKDFDHAKGRINKKANKVLNISHWVSRVEAGKMMRINIIFADTLNDELSRFLSQNANHNLSRVEGIISIAMIGSQIILPPLYGECDLAEVNRYRGVIQFIEKVLLNDTAQ